MSNNNQYRTCVGAILAYNEWQKNSLLSQALFPKKAKNKKKFSKDEEKFCNSILEIYNKPLDDERKNAAINEAIIQKCDELDKNKKAANPYFLALLRNLKKHINNIEQNSGIIKVVIEKNYHTHAGLALLLRQIELSAKSADIVSELKIAKTKAKLSSSNKDAINRTLNKLLKPLETLPPKVGIKRSEEGESKTDQFNHSDEAVLNNYDKYLSDNDKNEDAESDSDSDFENNQFSQPLQLEASSLVEVSQIIKRSIKHIEFLAKENKRLLACVKTISINNALLPQTLNVKNEAFANKIEACLQHINNYLAEIDKRRKGTNPIKKNFALTIRAKLVELLASEQFNNYQTATELSAEIEKIINDSQLCMTNPENIGLFYKKECGQMLAKISQELTVQEEIDTFVSNLFNDLNKPVSELAGIKLQALTSKSPIDIWRYYQYLALYLDDMNLNGKRKNITQEIKETIPNLLGNKYASYFSEITDFFNLGGSYDKNKDNNKILAQLAILATIDKNEMESFCQFVQQNYLGEWIKDHFCYLIDQEKPDVFAATTCLQLLEQLDHIMSNTKLSHNAESSRIFLKSMPTQSKPVATYQKKSDKKHNVSEEILLDDDKQRLSKTPIDLNSSKKIKNGYRLSLIALREQLKGYIPSPIVNGYGNLESIYVASVINSLNGQILHFLKTVPDNLQGYEGSYILTKNKLYYISCTSSIEPLTLTKFSQFKKKIARLNKNDLDTITLSDQDFEKFIEKCLKDNTEKSRLHSLKQTALQDVIQTQIRDDVTGTAYRRFVSPQFKRFNPDSPEKMICEGRLNQKMTNELNANLYLKDLMLSDNDAFIEETKTTYNDETEYTGPFFEYVREKANEITIVENKKPAEPQQDQDTLRLAKRYAILATYNDLKLNAQENKIQLQQFFNKKDIRLLGKLRDFSLDKKLFEGTKQLSPAPASKEPNSPPPSDSYTPFGLFSPESIVPSPNQKGQPDALQSTVIPMDANLLRVTAIAKDNEFEACLEKFCNSNSKFMEKFKQYCTEARALSPQSVDQKYDHAVKTAKLWKEIGENKKELKKERSFLRTILALFSARQRKKIADKTNILRNKYAEFFELKKTTKLEMQVNVNRAFLAGT